MDAALVLFHAGAGSARLARRSRLLALFVGFGLLSPVAQARLPDTGQDLCSDGTNLVACTNANTGDSSAYPRQDGRYGDDPAVAQGAIIKSGGGAKGFDYTKRGAAGNTLAIQNGTWATSGGYDSGSEAAGTKWSCVQDNITNLTWEVKTKDAAPGLRDWTNTYAWYSSDSSTNGGNAGAFGSDTCNGTLTPVYGPYCNTQNYISAVNAANLCGHSDWRLPSMRELLTLVHYGVSSPAIDASYFPNTEAGSTGHWTASSSPGNVAAAQSVSFSNGTVYSSANKMNHYSVRLVRGAPF